MNKEENLELLKRELEDTILKPKYLESVYNMIEDYRLEVKSIVELVGKEEQMSRIDREAMLDLSYQKWEETLKNCQIEEKRKNMQYGRIEVVKEIMDSYQDWDMQESLQDIYRRMQATYTEPVIVGEGRDRQMTNETLAGEISTKFQKVISEISQEVSSRLTDENLKQYFQRRMEEIISTMEYKEIEEAENRRRAEAKENGEEPPKKQEYVRSMPQRIKEALEELDDQEIEEICQTYEAYCHEKEYLEETQDDNLHKNFVDSLDPKNYKNPENDQAYQKYLEENGRKEEKKLVLGSDLFLS